MTKSLPRQIWIVLCAYVIGFYASTINRFRWRGVENIPRQGAVLLAANHTSAYDTVLLPWAVIRHFPNKVIWAPAKEELFRNPLFAWLISSWGAFPVRRGRDIRGFRFLRNLLAEETVMLFPEGTRRTDGTLGKGSRVVGKMIYDMRPVVIPAALRGFPQWRFPGRGQEALLTFGKPIEFHDLFGGEDNKKTHALIVDRVMSAIAELLKE